MTFYIFILTVQHQQIDTKLRSGPIKKRLFKSLFLINLSKKIKSIIELRQLKPQYSKLKKRASDQQSIFFDSMI